MKRQRAPGRQKCFSGVFCFIEKCVLQKKSFPGMCTVRCEKCCCKKGGFSKTVNGCIVVIK